MLDLWLPLAMGQRIVIAPSAVMKDFTGVRDLISQHQVVGVTGVPSLLQVSLLTVRSTHLPNDAAQAITPVPNLCMSFKTSPGADGLLMPPHLQALLDACTNSEQLSSVRYITVAGEALYPSTVMLCRKMAPNAHLCSGYGPTETTVRPCATAAVV